MRILETTVFLGLWQFIALATAQYPRPPTDGLENFLWQAMDGYKHWLRSNSLENPSLNKVIPISQISPVINVTGEIRNVTFSGVRMYYYINADFLERRFSVQINLLPSLEASGQYTIHGRVSNFFPVTGTGKFKVSNLEYMTTSSIYLQVYNFGITTDGRINLSGAQIYKSEYIFAQALPELEGLAAAGFEDYIKRVVKRDFVNYGKYGLADSLELYLRGTLDVIPLSVILRTQPSPSSTRSMAITGGIKKGLL